MKTFDFLKTIRRGATVLLMLLFIVPVWAQDASYFTIKGVVKDKRTSKTLEYVNISVPGTDIGTVTNANGEFILKINTTAKAKTVSISHVGYSTYSFPVKGENMDLVTILLVPNPNLLNEVTIYSNDPLAVVQRAIDRIRENYSNKDKLLTGFYRETIKKNRTYINVSEAVVDVFKSPYEQGIVRDQVQILKGRKLISPDPKDTLMVKLLGGPTLSVYVDIVKNPELILDPTALLYYRYSMGESVMIDDRSHYVVNFEPNVSIDVALYYGKLYIDKETFNISRAEFNLSMDDKNKATQAILRKKPFGLRFTPEEISFLVNYKIIDGRSRLNYLRSEVKFKCDWSKKLFRTNYTIVAETVITGVKEDNALKIPYRMSFRENQSLSDRVNSFIDPNFWEDYNIIAPEESLANAVNKLKKANIRAGN
ncbi:MAG: carboxypeptidase-like regulatory domain-containing protein [Thiovulaceae bacterium]|nr:carboxypeptidase-like regulatory domain-containing protein [Sulfurimonadaceae bacterium]